MRFIGFASFIGIVVCVGCGGSGGGGGGRILDGGPDLAPACDPNRLGTYAPVQVTVRQVVPSSTAAPGETINDVVQGQRKLHRMVLPMSTPRDELFVWLSGSGAEPDMYKNIQNIAAAAGYISVSLAYDNETKVAERCGDVNNPACDDSVTPDCTELVRREVLYGRERFDSPCVDIPRADSIENRLLRLVQALRAMLPAASRWLTASGDDLQWPLIAVGGWSQGGGHASMLARDRPVARAIYASKGSDAVICTRVMADPATCDLDGDGMVDSDETWIPAPWAARPRMTPGSRQFGIIHRRETAWNYSREAFELFGMGAKGSEVSVDGATYADYRCARSFFTDATPASGPADFHSSMAIDTAMAKDANGVPLLAPFYFYALTLPVP